MEIWLELAAFAGILALGQFSPGPDMLLLTQTSLAHGRRAGWAAMCGIVTGLAIHAAVAIGGMAVVLAQEGWTRRVMSIAASLYLGWLGYQLISESFVRIRSRARNEREAVPARGPNWYVRGLLCNLLNPKVVLFFAGFVARFLDGDRPAWWPYSLWLILVGEGFLLWALWVWVLQFPPFRDGYRKAAKWIDLLFGLALIALAVAIGCAVWQPAN